MKLNVLIPSSYKNEREYICRVILKEFLGLEYRLQYEDRSDWCLRGENGDTLTFPDTFLQTPADKWFAPESLPALPLQVWDVRGADIECVLVDSMVPLIYGDLSFQLHNQQAGTTTKSTALPLDIFGSAFFMLSQYEEAVKPDRDKHDRFPATASLAHAEGFLDRPIIDEYIEILWTYMKRLWPSLLRKERTSRVRVSCDVDKPYALTIKSWDAAARQVVGDLIKRKNVGFASKSAINAVASRFGCFRFDPYDTFDWIMGVNESIGNRVTFFFIADNSGGEIDGYYSIEEPRIRKIMRNMHKRGHEIGLHCSYNTYKDSAQTFSESTRLQRILEEEGIIQNELGCRQHFLRWDVSETARNLDTAGFNYDSTLTFADHAGFRCGTCHEYPMYDLRERRSLNIRQRPLVVMECSVIDSSYMGLGYSDSALEKMQSYKSTCRHMGGDYTLLWHNSNLLNEKARELYKDIIK